MNLTEASNSGCFMASLRSQCVLFENPQLAGSLDWSGKLDAKDNLQRSLCAFFTGSVYKMPALAFPIAS